MMNSIERNGRLYDLLFRTNSGVECDSYYYLHRETGMGYRIRFDGAEFNEVFIGMITQDISVIGGFEIINFIRAHDGRFPFFVPVLGLGLVDEFEEKFKQRFKQRLVYPCGLNFQDNHCFKMSDVVESLEKERIIFKKDLPGDIRFHYGHKLIEMYDIYDPITILNSLTSRI